MQRLKPFELSEPATTGEAAAILSGGKAMICAGGTDLIPKLKREQFAPDKLVALGAIEDLSGVSTKGDTIRVGAMTTLADLAAHPSIAGLTALHDALLSVATPIIRSHATIGGNLLQDTRCRYYDRGSFWREAIGYCLKKDGDECRVAPGGNKCFATFCSDVAPALIALDATVTLAGTSERTIPLEALYCEDGMDHVDTRGDVLTRVTVTLDGRKSWYRKLRTRDSFDFPEAGVAVSVEERGDTARVCIAVTAVHSDVFVIKEEVAIADVATLADSAYRAIKPLDTLSYPPAYRKSVVQSFIRQAFDELLAPR